MLRFVEREVLPLQQRHHDLPGSERSLFDASGRYVPEVLALRRTGFLHPVCGRPSAGRILAGAALIREREHGTLEHLLAMPLRPVEIMLAKVLSMGAVVLLVCPLSLRIMSGAGPDGHRGDIFVAALTRFRRSLAS